MKKAVLLFSLLALIVAVPNMSPAQNTVSLIQNGNLDQWFNGLPVGWNLVEQNDIGTLVGAGPGVVEESTDISKAGSSMFISTGGGFTYRYVAHSSAWGAVDGAVDWTVSIRGSSGLARTRMYVQVQTDGTGPWEVDYGTSTANGLTGVGDVPAGWNDYSGTISAGTFDGGTGGNDRYRMSFHAIDSGTYVDNVSVTTDAPYRGTAGPYAGQISIADSVVSAGFGSDINYYLPYDVDNTTGTVTIDILDEMDTVVASFDGTKTGGLNTVAWDSTDDNAGGTNVADGTYRIRITVEDHVADGWQTAATNGSGATLFLGYSPIGVSTQTNQYSDVFGLLHSRGSTNFAAGYAASILLTPDLEPLVGDGYTSRVLRHPDDGGTEGNGNVWGGDFLPNSDFVYQVGQSEPFETSGSALDVNAPDASGGFTILESAREVAVVNEGGQLWAYSGAGISTSAVDKVRLDSNAVATTDSINVLNSTDLGEGLYSKDIEFDDAGNMYYLARDGRIFRWDAADVQAITRPFHSALTGAQAVWDIDFDGGLANTRTMGIEISGGTLYCIAVDALSETDATIYEIGDVSTANLVKTVNAGDIVLDSLGNVADGLYGSLDADGVGNLITGNRSPETIDLYRGGGRTIITTLAPLSQEFQIQTAPSSVTDWMNHY